jgi:hypothetical protein
MAVVDFLYSALILVMYFFICLPSDNTCGPTILFLNRLLYIAISEYLTSCFALANILIEVFLTLQRTVLLSKNATWFLKNTDVMRVCLVVFLVSFFYYLPVLFMHKIVTVRGFEHNRSVILDFKLEQTWFGMHSLTKTLAAVLSSIRIFLVTVVLLVLNVMTVFKFNQYLNRNFKSKHTRKIMLL